MTRYSAAEWDEAARLMRADARKCLAYAKDESQRPYAAIPGLQGCYWWVRRSHYWTLWALSYNTRAALAKLRERQVQP